jgi:hypothetical protein
MWFGFLTVFGFSFKLPLRGVGSKMNAVYATLTELES